MALLSIFRLPLLLLCLSGLLIQTASAQIPAFPGAEGFGAYPKGGRGGDVYHVTNLNNSGAGSFANGLATVPAAGRTIVFDVSGYVTFSGELRLTASKVTIAGQTAPGDGFGLKGGSFRVSGDDVVVRHIRMRNGVSADSLNLDSGSTNTIFDHIDVMLSNDENMSSFSSPPENMTFQWSINAWGMESHSAGGLWDLNQGTTHHTLWSHNHTRNPKARPGLLDWVNNVTFDWDIGFIMGDSETPANWKANVRGCYFICPPGNLRSVALEKARIDRNGNPNFSLFIDDSHMDQNGNALLDVSKSGYAIASGSYITSPTPFPVTASAVVQRDNYLTAYKKIISAVGPLRLEAAVSKPLRDELDTILVNNVTAMRRHHVSSPAGTGASNGGYGTLLSAPAPADTDRDGMPDVWELALGWNAGAQDHNTPLPSSGGFVSEPTIFPASTPAGYTRLEEYLHFLAVPHATMSKNTGAAPTFLDVDLRKFTSGFTAAPVVTISGVSGGTVSQSGPGGYFVRFTPTLNTAGRAKFLFTVTDSAGSTWTQQFGILVSVAGVPRDLVWVGNGSSNPWVGTEALWRHNDAPTAFSPGDSALFDDRGSAMPPIAIASNVLATAVTVDAAKSYTFSGAGGIASSDALTKRGSGSLTLSNTGANSFAAVSLEEGTLAINSSAALGTGTIALHGGTLNIGPHGPTNTLNVVGTATVTGGSGGGTTGIGAITGGGVLNVNATSVFDLRGDMSGFNGTIVFTGPGGIRFNGSTGSAAATFDLAGTNFLSKRTAVGTLSLGALSGGPGTTLQGATGSGNTSATTYLIGANGASTTFQGAIVNGGGTTGLGKEGGGTLTLTGTSSYTGTTLVSAGALAVNGTLGNTATTIASGASLRGSGIIGGPVVAESGARISPGVASGAVGTLRVGAGLTLTSPTLSFQLSANPASGNDAIIQSGGTLAMSGAMTFDFTLIDGVLGAGTYDLVTGATGSTASGVTFPHNLPTGTRQTYSVFRPAAGSNPSFIKLTVTGNPAMLTWTGANGGVWDLQTTTGNWTGGATSTFFNLDTVNFTDSSTNGTVTLAGTLASNVINVSNASTAYTFTGTGLLAGTARLVKNGAGTLTIGNTGASTFIGGTTLNAGTLALTAGASPLGAGPLAINGGTLHIAGVAPANSIVFSGTSAITSTANVTIISSTASTLSSVGPATVNLAGINGILTVNGPMSGFTGTFAMGSGNAMLRLNGSSNANFGSAGALFDLGSGFGTLANRNGGLTIELGAVQGGSGTTLQGRQSGSGASETTYRVGGLNTDHAFGGQIIHGGDQLGVNIVKIGTGNWILTGTSSFTGAVAVEQGKLTISGALSPTGTTSVQSGAILSLAGGTLTSEAVEIASGAQLTGNGTIHGDLNNSGLVTVSSGTLAITGDIVNNGTMRFTGGAVLNASGGFINNGVLDLLTGAGALPVGFENNGVVIDSSSLAQVQTTKNGNTVTLTVKSFTGHSYQLQRADSLLAPAWQNLGDAQAGNDGVLTFTDTAATGAQRFYRIAIVP